MTRSTRFATLAAALALMLVPLGVAQDNLPTTTLAGHYTVPAGTVLSVQGDLTLGGLIEVISDVPASGPNAFVVHATGTLTISGSLVAHTATYTVPIGQPAASGTSFVLSAARIVVTSDATVLAADGANGLGATGEGASLLVVAQSGGTGGSVIFDTPTLVLDGSAQAGNGGTGGNALGGLGAPAIGGHGGDSGTLWHHANLRFTPLGSGDGGNGGTATSLGDPLEIAGDALEDADCSQDVEGQDGANTNGDGEDGKGATSNGCNGFHGANGEDGSSDPVMILLGKCDGENGVNGANGKNAGQATGGDGGRGRWGKGGNGGNGDSVGGNGGNGGNGGERGTVACNGGKGGNGGNAGSGVTARGGSSGDGYTGCGSPGGASSVKGRPGTAGTGANEADNGERGLEGDSGSAYHGQACDGGCDPESVAGCDPYIIPIEILEELVAYALAQAEEAQEQAVEILNSQEELLACFGTTSPLAALNIKLQLVEEKRDCIMEAIG